MPGPDYVRADLPPQPSNCVCAADSETPRLLTPYPSMPARYHAGAADGSTRRPLDSPQDLRFRRARWYARKDSQLGWGYQDTMDCPTRERTRVLDRALAESRGGGYFQNLAPAVKGANNVAPLGGYGGVCVLGHGASMRRMGRLRLPETMRPGARLFLREPRTRGAVHVAG